MRIFTAVTLVILSRGGTAGRSLTKTNFVNFQMGLILKETLQIVQNVEIARQNIKHA